MGTKGILAGLAILAGTWLACGAVTSPSKATPTTKKKTARKRSGTSKTAAKSTSKSRAVAGKKTAKKASPPRQLAPTKERYQQIQQALAAKGYYTTEPNGVWGADSMDALKHFQADQNLPPDGKLTSLSLIALGLGPKRLSAQSPPPPVHTSQQQ